jgi:hypothetical protein
VTDHALSQALATYSAGLDAETGLLEQLHALSIGQQDGVLATDLTALTLVSDERERILASLVTLEHGLRPLRETIAANHQRARLLPGFSSVADRHRRAAELVERIMTSDAQTVEALRHAETARRFVAQTIEAGENTLAAYRRVVAPTLTNASLLDKRG